MGAGLTNMNTTPFTGTAAQRLRASQLAQSRIYFGRVYRASDPKWTGAERGITDTISNSAVSRRTVYGRALLGTISAYAETTGTSNEVLHLIQVLCEGPIDSIEKVYFDGEEVTFGECDRDLCRIDGGKEISGDGGADG